MGIRLSRLLSWMPLACHAIVLSVATAMVASCVAIVTTQEQARLFHPYILTTSHRFRVVDARPPESRTSRGESLAGDTSLWRYGDEQFSPQPVEVVVDRFACAFPATGREVTLVVTELDLSYEIARVGQMVPGCSVLILDCVITPSMATAYNRRRNVVSARLSGSFDGIPFSVGHRMAYDDHASHRQEDRVLSALQGAIDKALTAIHERLNPGKPPALVRETLPELPRPWYMPTPSQIGD